MKRFIFITLMLFSISAKTRELNLSSFSSKTKERLYQKIPTLKNNQWSFFDIENLINTLIIDEGYDAVHFVQDSPEHYRIMVGKVRRISSLKFAGMQEFSESFLRSETGLNENIAFDPNQLVEAGEKIRSLYEANGYPSTVVDISSQTPSPTEIHVQIDIKEGPLSLIRHIQFLTANSELKTKLERSARSFLKSRYTVAKLTELRNHLKNELTEAQYWRAEIEDPVVKMNFDESEVELIFQIQNPERYYFETDGEKKLNRSEISYGLKLDSYSSTNPNIAGELSSKTRGLYLSKGFARIEVDGTELQGSKPYTKRILLKINEGPRVKIEKYVISGTYSDKEKTYIQFIQDHSSDQIEDSIYVKDDLDVGLKNLVTDRWNQGYLQAKIHSTRTTYNTAKDRVTVSIQFEEGPLTKVQKIQFEGIKSVSEQKLKEQLKLKVNEPLQLSSLEQDILAIKDFYREQGFLEMTIQNEKDSDLVTYSEENTLGSLNFKIAEGPQVKVASILIDGNSITKDYVILKELEFKVGDILSPSKIEESISRLQRLGFFSSVDIKTLEEKTNISERTVLVRVSDRDPGLFNLGFGVNNERGLTIRGYTGVAYRNIQGTGRGGSLRFEGNYNIDNIRFLENKITLGYVEPYLFNSRTRGRLNVVRSTTIKDFDAKQASEVNQTTWSLEQDITTNLSATWDVLSIATIRDFYINQNGQDKSLDIGSTAITTDLDYRNHPFNPSRGTFTRFNIEYGSPFLKSTDTIEYVRSYGSFTHYLELSKKHSWIWANSLRAGYIQNLSKKEDGAVPYDKKGFILGGQSSIRGFKPDEAFPNKFDFAGLDNFDLKNSAAMTLFKSELRFPVWNAIGGALFYDGGVVKVSCPTTDTYCNQAQSIWRDTVGIALRYATPVGPVSFEYGWKVKPQGSRNEDPSVFHFSIGTF